MSGRGLTQADVAAKQCHVGVGPPFTTMIGEERAQLQVPRGYAQMASFGSHCAPEVILSYVAGQLLGGHMPSVE
jgi:hypothetical protein